ncbi:hypothetical protein PsorP6_004436 [Peronosclerospora sorghi]|uniref:Uncharacterized protein n=1 Tax=Peronosclerospora sorghi TaxID=230839 RepID=A0ACC0VQX7_9STRA|nr:hypothetical protein PsorP6_004436 [Peronosclerospora sorghi]
MADCAAVSTATFLESINTVPPSVRYSRVKSGDRNITLFPNAKTVPHVFQLETAEKVPLVDLVQGNGRHCCDGMQHGKSTSAIREDDQMDVHC